MFRAKIKQVGQKNKQRIKNQALNNSFSWANSCTIESRIPGKHKITSSFEKTRPGFFSRTVTTKYGSTTQEVEVKAEKTYIYSFDKKNEQYTFTEIN